MKNTRDDDKSVFVESIYCFWNALFILAYGFNLPDDVMDGVLSLASICESYFKDSFIVEFDCEE